MSTWNYRIIKHDKSSIPYYAIHEVYYEDNGDIWAYTTDPISISQEELEDIEKELIMILADIKRYPVLLESELPEAPTEEELQKGLTDDKAALF